MGTFLLHNPWIQFYLLYAGALWIAFLWDYLCRSQAARDGARRPQAEAVRGRTTLSPLRRRQKPPRPVSRAGR
jgi:hypothetical protein